MSQQRILETLRDRRRRGEFPAVDVGGVVYEFGGVVFGGTSPSVQLIDPQGKHHTKAAIDWARAGANFRARSRNLRTSYAPSTPRPDPLYRLVTRRGDALAYRAPDASAARAMHRDARGPDPGEDPLTIDWVASEGEARRPLSGAVKREVDAYLATLR